MTTVWKLLLPQLPLTYWATIAPSAACISQPSACVTGCSYFPLVSQATASRLPPPTYFSCHLGSWHTQLFGSLWLPLNFWTDDRLLSQPPGVPLRHHLLIVSEREAVCHHPQQPTRGGERPVALKSIGVGNRILGCLPVQVPQLVARSCPLPRPLSVT